MCFGCWQEEGSYAIDNDRVRAAAEAIRRVYEFSEVGGALHVVVDDFNADDEAVASCAARIERADDGREHVSEQQRIAEREVHSRPPLTLVRGAGERRSRSIMVSGESRPHAESSSATDRSASRRVSHFSRAWLYAIESAGFGGYMLEAQHGCAGAGVVVTNAFSLPLLNPSSWLWIEQGWKPWSWPWPGAGAVEHDWHRGIFRQRSAANLLDEINATRDRIVTADADFHDHMTDVAARLFKAAGLSKFEIARKLRKE